MRKQIKQDNAVNRVQIKMDDVTFKQLEKIKKHYDFTSSAEAIRALIKRGSMNL